jgi:hypothetical protein
MAVFVNPLM